MGLHKPCQGGLPPPPPPHRHRTGQTPLPDDLEQAALEQVAFWFQTRDRVGATRIWPSDSNYQQFADIDLVPSVRAVLRKHTRFVL